MKRNAVLLQVALVALVGCHGVDDSQWQLRAVDNDVSAAVDGIGG